MYDYLVVGTGLFGAVFVREAKRLEGFMYTSPINAYWSVHNEADTIITVKDRIHCPVQTKKNPIFLVAYQ